jgi:hypothetical protein
MKTIKLILVAAAIMLAAVSISATAGQLSRSVKPTSAKALVADLYRQHKKRSPFFQTRSRTLLDKYFAKTLADLIWRDQHSAGDEVGVIDGDPLFNAQDMEIKNFAIGAESGGPRMATVPVSFENFGERHEVKFQLHSAAGAGWKISNIVYDDGSSLFELLKSGLASRKTGQTVKIFLVAVGDDGKTGKKIGCGDSLVAVERPIKKTAAPLAAAIRELLSTPQHPGSPGLENFWKGRQLKVTSVAIVNHTATIRLSGEVFVAGVCDEPRIQSQIEATARQFATVKQVKVFIGKRTLADAIR